MRRSYAWAAVAVCAAALGTTGCSRMPGYPKSGPEVIRPDEVMDFGPLYAQNCAGCHGKNGHGGAALPLNNPAYLAIAGEANLRDVTAKGVKGTLMPAFAQSAGGMLTDEQIDALAKGMLAAWARPAEFAGTTLPPYADNAAGNATNGQKVFVEACGRCHGTDGTGVKAVSGQPLPKGATKDTILDVSYLALVSNQSLRSLILAGRPDEDVPDWRSYITSPAPRALTSQDVNDIVAWLAAHRESAVSQPAQSNAGNAAAMNSSKSAAGKEAQ